MDYNKATFIGRVKDKPQVTDQGGTKRAFLALVIANRVKGANGQWVDQPIEVPIYAEGQKADLIEQYVVPGHELLLETRYQPWMEGADLKHTFVVLNLNFGYKPKQQGAAGGRMSGPPPAG